MTPEVRRERGRLAEARYRARKANDTEWRERKRAYDRNLRKSRPDLVAEWTANRISGWRTKAPWMFSFRAARRRAKKFGLEFSLTLDWCKAQWDIGVSTLSGLPFGNEKGAPNYPSIDRIDSALGYTEQNCRMILLAENLFKNEWSDDAIVAIACAIADKHRA